LTSECSHSSLSYHPNLIEVENKFTGIPLDKLSDAPHDLVEKTTTKLEATWLLQATFDFADFVRVAAHE
jgi:hypothetical protein